MSHAEEPCAGLPKPHKSPPLAFQMTSNDALIARSQPTFPSQWSSQPYDYLTNPSARFQTGLYDVTSPVEQDLNGQVRKQTEALRLQHQAFVVERECWEMERDRLLKRIAALEGLLKSPNGHRSVNSTPESLPDHGLAASAIGSSCSRSPARSPVRSPLVKGHDAVLPVTATPTVPPTTQSHRLSGGASTASRLPSIAEHSTSPKEEKKAVPRRRESAPQRIEIPITAVFAASAFEDELEVKVDVDEAVIASPLVARGVLSPPPAEYRRDAGHTPLRVPSRPESSSSDKLSVFLEGLHETPTRRNTARNKSAPQHEDEDVGLTGPLRLPELPGKPTDENFTMDALTARLKYIEEHPDENRPMALCARPNVEEASEADISELTITQTAQVDGGDGKDTPSLSQDGTLEDMSPPPASANSQPFSPHEYHIHGGIKLKPKTSMNFGAPLGQLRCP